MERAWVYYRRLCTQGTNDQPNRTLSCEETYSGRIIWSKNFFDKTWFYFKLRFEANLILPKLGSVNESLQETIIISHPTASTITDKTPVAEKHMISSGIGE